MKPIKKVAECEFCGKLISLNSPPDEQYYTDGRIEISAGDILLSNLHTTDNHTADISGYYCNFGCLRNHIRRLRDKRESNGI